MCLYLCIWSVSESMAEIMGEIAELFEELKSRENVSNISCPLATIAIQ